jgi:ribonuclease P protein component
MSKRRLHLSRADFTNTTQDKGAKRATSAHFSVTFSRQGVGSAVVVSKKVAKSSVERHLLKRRVREAAAPWNSDVHALIVYARPGAAALPYSEIVSELTSLLQRIAE